DEETDDDEGVVHAGHDDARREPKVEPERQVDHDEQRGDRDGVSRAVPELFSGLGTDPFDAKRLVGNDIGAELFAEPLEQLIALRLELDLDAVIALVDLGGVARRFPGTLAAAFRRRANANARNARHLLFDLLEVGLHVVTRRNFVAAERELHLGGARLGRAAILVDRLAFSNEAERIADLIFVGLAETGDVLDANEIPAAAVLALPLDGV